MKILAFTDVHGNSQAHAILKERAAKADILVCAGDMSVFGMELIESLEAMNSWGKPIYFIHGNHEDDELFTNVNKQFPNLHFVHKKDTKAGDLLIWGYGGGGFARNDPGLEKAAKKLKATSKRIMLFHGPPSGTTLDYLEGYGHVGCESRRKVIELLKPAIVIAGHLHENFDAHDKIGNTFVLNPGPLGKLIDLNPKKEAKK